MRTDRSASLHQRASLVSPGGVHGAARYYPPYPLFFERAEGQYLWDVDGHRYLDLHAAWGTAALGYNDSAVREAVQSVLEHEGVFFGAPHPREVALSQSLIERIPCAELVALCGGGGSDPLYFGYRLARSRTGKRRLLKFEGEYHGWHDPLAVSVLPPLEEAGTKDSPNPVPVSSGAAEDSQTAIIGILNDVEMLEHLFERWAPELACAVIEPVCHTSGCILIDQEFLARLRELCTAHGVVLMFDEIMTGFRHAVGGAQSLVGVTPDLAAFGKAMGNGFPISALVGQEDLMSELTPLGKAFYSGTYCGHLLSVAAAQATLGELEVRNVPAHTSSLVSRISEGVNNAARELGVAAVCQSFGAIFCVYFGTAGVRNYRDVVRIPERQTLNSAYRHALLDADIFMYPHIVNRSFIGAAHSVSDADRVLEATVDFLRSHREEINLAAKAGLG
jgi:glutamate-1-semialdehyde 2,1-aminomutase